MKPVLSINKDASTIIIRTRATGMLARLAHDLQLAARFDGSVDEERDDGSGPWRGELAFRADDVRVEGVVKNGALDTGVLSSSDIADIEKKLRGDVLPSGLRVVARGKSRESAELEVTANNKMQRVTARLRTAQKGAHEGLEGTAMLSLKVLGIKEIRGPFGAFTVDDAIEVRAFIALQ